MSTLSPDLINAYKATHFHVRAGKPFILEVGKESAGVIDLSRRLGVSCAAFITAYNPYSKVLTLDENDARNALLKADMDALKLTSISGFGQDPLGQWEKEESYLICGLGLEEAKAVGVKYEQNAIVWCGADAVAQLILLR